MTAGGRMSDTPVSLPLYVHQPLPVRQSRKVSGTRLADHCRVVAAMVFGLVALVGCSTSRGHNEGGELQGSRPAPEELAAADRQWSPDLNGDGDADVVALVGDQVLFFLRTEQGYIPVSDTQGKKMAVRVGEQVTFTCQVDGVWTQRFDPPLDATGFAPLYLSRLDLDGSVGSWVPSPSFMFGPDFELPDIGMGCPT